jgi:hypothetical protein
VSAPRTAHRTAVRTSLRTSLRSRGSRSGPVLAILIALSGLLLVGLAAAGPTAGPAYTAPPSSLAVKVTLAPNVTYSGATVVLHAWVTGNGSAQPGITVSFSSSAGGSFSPSTGSTGSFGEVNTSFTAPSVASTQSIVLTASASATGSGFLPGSGSAGLTVHASGAYLVVTPSFPQGTTVHSASSDLIVGRVTDAAGQPVAGANVTLAPTRGSVTPAVAVSGPSGNTTFTLRAPTVTNATQVWLLFGANATGYANGSATAPITVNSGVAVSLYVAVTPSTGNVSAGGTVHLSVTVRSTNASGTLVSGANVTLILSDGTYGPSLVLTNAQGIANFTYTAPFHLGKPSLVTVTASATATNFAPGSATAAYTVAAGISGPPPFSPWSTSWFWLLLVAVLVVIALVVILATRRRRQTPPPPTPSPPRP